MREGGLFFGRHHFALALMMGLAHIQYMETGNSPTGETQMNITAQISAMVLAKIAEGVDPIEALKEVCGAGNVDAMIDSLYHALRAKAAQ